MSSAIIHILNVTEHLAASVTHGRHLLQEFQHIPLVNSDAVYFTTKHEPCYFNQAEIFLENRSRSSYQSFNPLHSVVVFLGYISETKDIEEAIRSCYPWVAILCSSRIRRNETLRCCDAFYQEGRIEERKFKFETDAFNEKVIPFFSKQVCNKCGPWQNFSSQIVEVTSKNTKVHIRVPRSPWIFRPGEDHSAPFPEARTEANLPYCNKILKVFSQRFNMSFRFQPSRYEFYGQHFSMHTVGRHLTMTHAWDGGLNALMTRRSLFAVGSVTLYASRERFFSSTNVFSIEDVLLLNKVRRIPSSGSFVLDNVQPEVIYLYVLTAIICSIFVHLRGSRGAGNFPSLLAALILMPMASNIKIPGKKICVVLAILRLTGIVLTTHLSANILDQMMSSRVLFAYKDIIGASGHLKKYPQTKLWGYPHTIDSVEVGLNSVKQRGAKLSPQDTALFELLRHRSDFGYRPENSKITVYAGGSENDFIMDEQSAAAYHLAQRDRPHRHTYINAITGLNNMYETVLLQKGCTIRKNFSVVLRRLEESGHIMRWRPSEIKKHRNNIDYRVLTMEAFHLNFHRLILFEIVLGSLIALIELAIHSCRSEF